jgi:hypothetical protein
MAIADPLSRLSRQEHRVDNLDLPLLLEMLLTELPDEIRKLEHFRVNAEKDTNVATRIVQRWRTRSNPISNTIGGSEGTEFLISAPYADKLPIKVAEYIRQNVPFAILIPISLLNEIDRIGKNEIDEAVRDKRSRMKLVISTSLAQAWLINHPSCQLAVSKHSVFFTETPATEPLQRASSSIFSSWYTSNIASIRNATLPCITAMTRDLDELVVSAIDRLMTGGKQHKHDAFAQFTPREMRANKRAKQQLAVDESDHQDEHTAIPSDQSDVEVNRVHNIDVIPQQQECRRTLQHPLHTISTGPTPLPIEQWPDLQDTEDIPSNMMRVPQDEMKKGRPPNLIVLRDNQGRQRTLVPNNVPTRSTNPNRARNNVAR